MEEENLMDGLKHLKTINEKLDNLIEYKGKAKKFKLPWRIRKGLKFKLKKNYCLTLVIRNNCKAMFQMLPIEDDTIRIPFNDTYHIATVDYLLSYDKYPLLIIPEWNLKPFNAKENMEQAASENTLSLPEKVIITKIKMAQANMLKKNAFNGKTWIWIGIIAVAAIYVLSQVMSNGGEGGGITGLITGAVGSNP